MPATHHVFVYPDSCTYRVTPPHLLVGKGDTIIFHTTAESLAIFFPEWTPFESADATRGKAGWAVLEMRGMQTVTVSATAVPGRYPYAVYCNDATRRWSDFAKGGSEPEILIYG